jgi:hypothetical protein
MVNASRSEVAELALSYELCPLCTTGLGRQGNPLTQNLSVAREKKSAYVDCAAEVDRIGFGCERTGRLIPFHRASRFAAADLDPTLEPRHLDGL